MRRVECVMNNVSTNLRSAVGRQDTSIKGFREGRLKVKK